MADFFDIIEGFEDYGPVPNGATYDSITFGNFENNSGAATLLMNQSWLARWLPQMRTSGSPGTCGIITGLNGSGKALVMSGNNSSRYVFARSFKGNYSRVKFGWAFKTNLLSVVGMNLMETLGIQCSIGINTSGQIYFNRGSVDAGTTLFTSSALILANTRNWIEADVTIHNTAGTLEIRLNGNLVSGSNLTGLNTRGSGSNNYCNQWGPTFIGTATGSKYGVDDCYVRDNSGGTASFLGDRNIDGLIVTADGSSIQFTPTASISSHSIPAYAAQSINTNAPGANFLHLQPITADVAKTMNSVSILPGATSAGAKFKGVIYSDSAGAPGSLLKDGTEVVGCTSGVVLTLPLASSQALSAATQYWIGYYTDTSVVMLRADEWVANAQRKANTYGSGAPAGPLSGMTTAQNVLVMWPNCTGQAVNYPNVYMNPPAFLQGTGYAYNQSGTVGHKDYFTMSDLPGTPVSIDVVAVSVLARRSDAGARTLNIKVKSSGSEANGDNAGVTPPTTFNWITSLFTVDPNTGAAWTAAGVNAMEAGYEIAS